MCFNNFYIISYFLSEEFNVIPANIFNFRKIFVVKVGNVKYKQFPRDIRALMQNERSFLWHNHFCNFKELHPLKNKHVA
jgi:hypothetical protein